MWCLAMTPSIRNLVEYGSTRPDTRLITMSTKPIASNPRRGRIKSQTVGAIARSRWVFIGGFWGGFCGEFTVWLDTTCHRIASFYVAFRGRTTQLVSDRGKSESLQCLAGRKA